MRWRATLVLLVGLALIWIAPLLGLAFAEIPIDPFLRFPPRSEAITHAPFSWSVFIALGLLVMAVAIGFGRVVRIRMRARRRPEVEFPWWGILGLGLLAIAWVVAWSDALVPSQFSRHTFSVLWLGYILGVNGLLRRDSGESLLTHRTRWFLALFPISAGFWWLFEYLNQFVDNWHYAGIHANSPWDYIVQASLPFSTVLPAVASTWAWLRSRVRVEYLGRHSFSAHPALAGIALATGIVALGAIGLWPEILYPLLWVAPLCIFSGLQRLVLGDTPFALLGHADWGAIVQAALAGLICGLFWELWNYGSAAKWHYSIPYVQRYHVFEMPLLGYAGYLPFGILCVLVLDLVARLVERRTLQ